MEEIGGYRVVRRIGSGGMGTVYEAVSADDQVVALKLLHPHISRDPSARARLAREVELLHRVRGKGVARVLDAEVEDDEAFVVTELIDGPTLEDDVAAEGPFRPDELRGLAHGLADAIHAIHRVGVVHRDLKPGNVMLSPAGPVIIDFGIAQVADDTRLTQTGMVTGTPGYLDPEVIDGAPPSPTCDWWAWAAVLVFAATGRKPFGTGPAVAVLKRMSLGQVDLEGVEPLVATTLWAALQPRPAKRLDTNAVLAVLDGRWGRGDLDEALASLDLRVPVAGEDETRAIDTAALAAPAPTLVAPSAALVGSPPTLVVPTSDPGTAAAPAVVEPVGPLRHEARPRAAVDTTGSEPLPGPPAGGPATWPGPDPWQEPPAWARPAAPQRATVAAVGFFLVAAAGIWPGVAILLFAALLGTVGMVGYASRSMRSARLRRGPRGGDVARAVASSPWFLVRAVLVSAGLLLLGAGTSWVAVQVSALILSPDSLGQWAVVRVYLLLWIGAAVGALVVWFGPGAGVLREGTRSAVATVLPYRPMRLALGGLCVLLGVAFLVATAAGSVGGPTWEPLPTPSWLLL